MGNISTDKIMVGEVFELDDDPTPLKVKVVTVTVVSTKPTPEDGPMNVPNEPEKDALLKKLNELEG